MGIVGDFVIDSIIKEGDNIIGFAVYPLYGDANFKSVRMVMKKHSLNTFRTDAHDMLLHNTAKQNQEFYKIVIENVDDNGFPTIQKITDPDILKAFEQLPTYFPLSGDAT